MEETATQAKIRLLEHDLEHKAETIARLAQRAEAAEAEVRSRQAAIDVVLRELSACKDAVVSLKEENSRLRRDLEASQRARQDLSDMSQRRMGGTPREDSLSATNASNAAAGVQPQPLDASDVNSNNTFTVAAAADFMVRCFGYDVEPPVPVLRSLASNASLDCNDLSFKQMAALNEVLAKHRDSIFISRFTLPCDEEKHDLLPMILANCSSLSELVLVRADDRAAPTIASLLLTSDQITSVRFDDLKVRDEALQEILRAVNKRQVLTEQHHASDRPQQPLFVECWNLSKCTLGDELTFNLIQGNAIVHIDVSQSDFVTSDVVRMLLGNCNGLRSLNLSQTKVDNRVCKMLKQRPNVVSLDVTGCDLITILELDHVTELRTDLSGIGTFVCPSLVDLPTVCTHFQVVTWQAPLLQGLSLSGVTLGRREMANFAASSTVIESLDLVNCRVSDLDILLRRLRRLTHVSLHGTRGVTDNDLQSIGQSILSVDLSENFCLSDKALARLASVCICLRKLTLKRCANITSEGILLFREHDHLEYLNVLGTKKITSAALERLAQSVPTLKHVIHEVLISSSTAIRVDREDTEEEERRRLASEEESLSGRKVLLPLTHSAQSPRRPETSPVKSGRSVSAMLAAPL